MGVGGGCGVRVCFYYRIERETLPKSNNFDFHFPVFTIRVIAVVSYQQRMCQRFVLEQYLESLPCMIKVLTVPFL